MALSSRFVDEAGNITERYNESGIRESLFFNALTDPAYAAEFEYPLTIALSGSGVWRNGACIKRRRCTIFGVELVTAGGMHYVQDGKEYLVEPGMIIMFRPGSIIECEPGDCGFMHKRFIVFWGPAVDAMREQCGLTDCDACRPADSRTISRLMRKTSRLLRVKPHDFQRDLSVLSYEIMLTLGMLFRESHYPPPVNAVLHYMSRNLERAPTISDFADAAGLSRSQLHRVFKQHLAESPVNYYLKMKVRHAATMLRNSPHRPIGDIARQLSFENQSYFSFLFGRVMGMPPKAYRDVKKARKPDPRDR
jgi:AraC-like DNA-binding protein